MNEGYQSPYASFHRYRGPFVPCSPSGKQFAIMLMKDFTRMKAVKFTKQKSKFPQMLAQLRRK